MTGFNRPGQPQETPLPGEQPERPQSEIPIRRKVTTGNAGKHRHTTQSPNLNGGSHPIQPFLPPRRPEVDTINQTPIEDQEPSRPPTFPLVRQIDRRPTGALPVTPIHVRIRPSRQNRQNQQGGQDNNNGHKELAHLPTAPLPATPIPGQAGQNQQPGTDENNSRKDLDHLPTEPLPPASNGHHNRTRTAPSVLSALPAPHSISKTQEKQPEPELEELDEHGNIILHRSPNFFVRTVYRAGQRPHPLRKPTGRTTVLPKVLPDQDKRIAASETRLMPKVGPINPVKARTFPVPAWAESIVVIIGLLASLVAHAFNMFNFPRYELDEGTYMSSAWAILNGLITPYPYGYGHPPAAWMQISLWVQLTGGFFTFGNALNSGRVLMLLYALACSLLVYLIVRHLGGSRTAGLLAMVIFSLSPLSITYQRQVLLDNVGTFWLLLSLYLLVVGNSRLFYIVSAAISFGIAVLSKEIFVLFLPGMIYALWLHSTKFQRKFALVAFTYTIIAIGSGFVLLAILKGELFPYSWHLPGDTHPHLSMLDTFIGQAQRGQGEGSLSSSWANWTQGDIVLMVFSIAAVAFNLVVGWWNRKLLLISLLAISFWLLLVRGGIVLSFYIIPLIPLIALNAAMAIHTITNWIGKLVRFDIVRAVLILLVIGGIAYYDTQNFGIVFTQHPTSAQTDAMVWIRDHVPHTSFIVINSYLYMDLRQPGGEGVGNGATYPFAHVYFNVAFDPELHDGLLNGNWDRIDYIVADSEMLNDINNIGGPMNIIKDALQHSILRAEFRADDHDQQIVIQVYQVMHKQPQPTVYQQPIMAQAFTRNLSPLEGDRLRVNA